jgi:hypothetical protein
MKLLSPKLWLQQARADRDASRATKIGDCHKRYLLQQAYEKAIKALGLACMNEHQAKDKRIASALGDYFLHHHTPMTVFSSDDDAERLRELLADYPGFGATVHRQLKTIRTRILTILGDRTDAKIVKVWEKIDATRPTKSIDSVSYRYPFVDPPKSSLGIAPCAWAGWDAYQGPEQDVRDAIDELIRRAGMQVGIWEKR